MISKERENLIDDRLFSLYETVYITEMKSVLYNILFYFIFFFIDIQFSLWS